MYFPVGFQQANERRIGQHDQKPYMSPKHVAFFFDKKIKAVTAGYLHSAVLTRAYY